ncbi:hypothetical protein [Mycoplasmopsis pullorum]|uniref:Lipoprotein n=1 Tax=Mycoplasmopsis pullorum TaxID=48003 RepID=A0A1L4FSZ4_9BACT|nr:hypothetical protein [Mycoplasmopsis pullorum]APJ38730.1 hypothetical protein BLA55_03660 [Mycoplasmopsis pullorum]
MKKIFLLSLILPFVSMSTNCVMNKKIEVKTIEEKKPINPIWPPIVDLVGLWHPDLSDNKYSDEKDENEHDNSLKQQYPENFDWSNANEKEIINFLIAKNFQDHLRYSSEFGKISDSLQLRIKELLNNSNISFNVNEYNTKLLHRITLKRDEIFNHLRKINDIYNDQIQNKKIFFYLEHYQANTNKNITEDWRKYVTLTINIEESELPKFSSFKDAEELFKLLNLSNMTYDTKVENNTLYEQPYEMTIFTFKPSDYKVAIDELNSFFVSLGIKDKIPFRFKIWTNKLDFRKESSDSITNIEKMTWYNAKWSIGIHRKFLKDIEWSKLLLYVPFFQKCPHIDELVKTNFVWYNGDWQLEEIYKKSIYSSDVDYWAWPRSWW